MCTSTSYVSNNGNVNIATANPNLDGTGAMGSLLTASLDGTIVKNITVKAAGTTSQGMVRFFLNDGVSSFLLKELMIPANVPTAVVPAFSVCLEDPITLQTGYSIDVSTQNSESFNVIASAISWQTCECPKP